MLAEYGKDYYNSQRAEFNSSHNFYSISHKVYFIHFNSPVHVHKKAILSQTLDNLEIQSGVSSLNLQIFAEQLTLISTKRDRLFTVKLLLGAPGFSDLPTNLEMTYENAPIWERVKELCQV